MRNHLCAAGEYAMSRWEIQNGGSEPVDSKLRIAIEPSLDVHRFLLEQKAGNLYRITADVHQRPAAPFPHVANIGGIAIEITEDGLDRSEIANLSRAHDLAGADPLRMRPNHERLSDLDAGPVARLNQRAALGHAQRDRFFAQHVLAGLSRANRPGHVQMVREWIIDGLDFRVGQQFLIGSVGSRNL